MSPKVIRQALPFTTPAQPEPLTDLGNLTRKGVTIVTYVKVVRSEEKRKQDAVEERRWMEAHEPVRFAQDPAAHAAYGLSGVDAPSAH